MNIQENKERFLQLCQKIIHRPGMEDLLNWLEKSDFFIAPASTKYHGAEPGGLCAHSLNVYDEIVRLLAAYPEIRPAKEESIIISTLFHDLCKVNYYAVEKRNRKNEEGKWEQYDAYTINEKFCYGGHGSKSVFLLSNFIKLEPEEAIAIHNHMSAFTDDWRNVGSVFMKSPFAWLVSVADQSACYVVEGE